jgi:general secretion pathway protein M
MIEELKTWFEARAPRERWLLGVAATLSALVIVVYGMLFPAMSALSTARNDLNAAVEKRGRIEAKLASFRGAASGSPVAPIATGQPLQAMVKDSAESAGFELAEVNANGSNGVRFRMASVKAGALLAWISRLETQGLELSEIQLRKTEDGFVSADVALATRS